MVVTHLLVRAHNPRDVSQHTMEQQRANAVLGARKDAECGWRKRFQSLTRCARAPVAHVRTSILLCHPLLCPKLLVRIQVTA